MSKYKFDFSNKIQELRKKEEESKNFGDQRFWNFTFDKDSKKGSAIIRFLPDRAGSDALPYIQYFSHWFEYHDGNSLKNYIENCATSINKDCPVCIKNRQLFKSPHSEDEIVARKRKRKINYVSNILVVKDPSNPSNEGKVFLFKYGPQIFSYLTRALNGPSKDDEDYDEDKDYSSETWIPFDFFEGGNFHLKSTLKKNSTFLTYTLSEWMDRGIPIFPELDDDARDKKLDKIYSPKNGSENVVTKLDEWLDPLRFPSANVVSKKLASILGDVVEEFLNNEESESVIDDYDEEPVIDKKEVAPEPIKVKRNDDMGDEDYLNSLLDK